MEARCNSPQELDALIAYGIRSTDNGPYAFSILLDDQNQPFVNRSFSSSLNHPNTFARLYHNRNKYSVVLSPVCDQSIDDVTLHEAIEHITSFKHERINLAYDRILIPFAHYCPKKKSFQWVLIVREGDAVTIYDPAKERQFDESYFTDYFPDHRYVCLNQLGFWGKKNANLRIYDNIESFLNDGKLAKMESTRPQSYYDKLLGRRWEYQSAPVPSQQGAADIYPKKSMIRKLLPVIGVALALITVILATALLFLFKPDLAIPTLILSASKMGIDTSFIALYSAPQIATIASSIATTCSSILVVGGAATHYLITREAPNPYINDILYDLEQLGVDTSDVQGLPLGSKAEKRAERPVNENTMFSVESVLAEENSHQPDQQSTPTQGSKL